MKLQQKALIDNTDPNFIYYGWANYTIVDGLSIAPDQDAGIWSLMVESTTTWVKESLYPVNNRGHVDSGVGFVRSDRTSYTFI